MAEYPAPKRNFLRRTKATAPPDSANPDAETTTSKYKRNFKSRTTTEAPESTPKSPEENIAGKEENGGKRPRRPSLNSAGARNERPTRNFVRRRLGGANATTTTSSPSSPTPSSSRSPASSSSSVATRRPFRVAQRRRPASPSSISTSTTSTTEPPITERELPTTELPASEEYLQDIGDTDFIEDPTPDERPIVNLAKTRRPLLLKDAADQKPSATNEDERKRHSKKYSSSFKQNQLDEVLRKKELASSSIEEVTTDGVQRTTVEDNDAETALAIAAHQLLSAPPPSIPNYDEPKHTRKSNRPPTTIHEYEYTSPTYEYTRDYEYTTPNDYIQSTTVYDATTGFNSAKTTYTPKSMTYTSSPFTSRVSRPAAFTTASILSTLSKDPTTEFSRIQSTANPSFPRSTQSRGFTRASTSTLSEFSNVPPSLGPSTARYVSTTDKLIPVPVEDYSFTTGAYSSISQQEPSYFTREYLLESPVTKTYDDEYQYLSPTTPETTTRKVNKKITYRRKISTTIPPTVQSYVPEVTPTPRRVPNRKPFEKIPLDKAIRPKFKPVENYDYYDDGAEHLASKYDEGTKVVLHSKGTIECLDIGNFPHPSSCKKFISCARLENGSLLGWEYICPKGLSFDPVGGICNWSAGLGCNEKDV
ncbi:chitin binding peritrophin-A domain-containing protein [Phthorimaea operculella]|nr:chitin binding peritrophin-A domain-containing protein [Phthorimaea operculella]